LAGLVWILWPAPVYKSRGLMALAPGSSPQIMAAL
jgi:hypothetical protein